MKALEQKKARAHVFVVDQRTFAVHRDRAFCGIGPRDGEFHTYQDLLNVAVSVRGQGHRGMIADILGTRPGDLVFFYERDMGFHGVYRIAGRPFFDSTSVPGIGPSESQHVGPNICLRVSIECEFYFPKPVPEDMLFATPDREARFWVWFYRKIQGARGCTSIDPQAAETLTQLLVRTNEQPAVPPTMEPYTSGARTELSLPLGGSGTARYEDLLRGWLIANIDDRKRPDVRSVFGPVEELEWFANNVPYHVSRRNIDVLVFHSTSRYCTEPFRYKYSVVELKRERAGCVDVEQLVAYCKWVAGRLADGDADMVQPILITSGFDEAVTSYAQRSDFGKRGIKLIEYRIENGDIALHEVETGGAKQNGDIALHEVETGGAKQLPF